MTKINKGVYINLKKVNSITVKYLDTRVFFAFTLEGNTYHPSQYFNKEEGKEWFKKIMEEIDENN